MADSQWRTLYQAAVFEVDPEKIEGRAKAAELAINAHVFSDHQHISGAERSDMLQALTALGVLILEGQAVAELKRDQKR
ncbi:MAG TPA: hypothetical protein VN875_04065 [Candidatus Binatus sp.]|jgi:hypothetical protein|nr:hypothetical protein [Candidatus Binatus sp.]